MNFIPAQVTEDHPLVLQGEISAEVLALHEAAARAQGSVKVELLVTKDEENFAVTGWLQTTLLLVCGRCAEWIPWPVRTEVEHLFEGPQPNCIDLTPFIREDILLELPLNAVCRLGADGRCPVTGEVYQPRPETSGSLADETVWEALSKIKTKD
ncbi:MAG TPA: hypothetical protein VL981_11915 [Candidatus Methylacidiphilales bacterium]|nr:hypothetical protein [Candidatus Methylacidiphilales bacterium]